MAPLSKWLNGWRLRDPWWVFVVSFSLTTPWFCFVTTDERLNTETVFGNLCLCFNIILLRHSMACAPAYRYNTTNVQVVRFSLVVGKYHSTTPPCTATSPWGNTENCDYSPTPPKRIPPRGLLITLLLMGGGRFPMGGEQGSDRGDPPPMGKLEKGLAGKRPQTYPAVFSSSRSRFLCSSNFSLFLLSNPKYLVSTRVPSDFHCILLILLGPFM